MASNNPIDVTLCRRIAYEEWKKFKNAQDIAIGERLNVQTGTLHAGGAGRRYSITTNKVEIVATLKHPDYERYQDMKRLKHGRRKTKLGPSKMTRVSGTGKGIHNRLIWGRMNTIAFRCMNDLRGAVIKYIKSSRFALKAKKPIRI